MQIKLMKTVTRKNKTFIIIIIIIIKNSKRETWSCQNPSPYW